MPVSIYDFFLRLLCRLCLRSIFLWLDLWFFRRNDIRLYLSNRFDLLLSGSFLLIFRLSATFLLCRLLCRCLLSLLYFLGRHFTCLFLRRRLGFSCLFRRTSLLCLRFGLYSRFSCRFWSLCRLLRCLLLTRAAPFLLLGRLRVRNFRCNFSFFIQNRITKFHKVHILSLLDFKFVTKGSELLFSH